MDLYSGSAFGVLSEMLLRDPAVTVGAVHLFRLRFVLRRRLVRVSGPT